MNHYNLCLGCMENKGAAVTCPNCGLPSGAGAESVLQLPLGLVLQDKYLLGRVLGQGGFGITYLAWDLSLNIKLAIKEYLPQQLATRSAGQNTITIFKSTLAEEFRYGLNKFLEEARTLARFNEHPNIVTIRDYFTANNTAYLVMNFIEGATLEQHLRSKGGRISYEQALQILMPVLDALKEVHEEGFMHRDISPDNILINKKGRVILIDFGAARQEMREKSKSLSVILKAGYAPEEQYRSRGKQGPWTDIYAVAATMYRCITGQVSPEAMDRLAEDDLVPVSKLGVTIGGAQEAALIKALSVRAEGRFQTVEDFQAALLSTKPANAVAEPVLAREKRFAPPVIKRLAADVAGVYYIDYEKGTTPLASLPIGARVVDPTWVWEFRPGNNYTGSGEKKVVIWVVVAKDHYDGLPAHVTLLSEELIGKFTFDNSKRLLSMVSGVNHWGDSGTGNADCGLRPWLNSNSIHAGEGFYLAFSAYFKRSVLTTAVPNREFKHGATYNTNDFVFIPSTMELGDIGYRFTYQIGTIYPYFLKANNDKRVALLNGEDRWYWTRSPYFTHSDYVRCVLNTGNYYGDLAGKGGPGVRPALNLKADTLVSEIRQR